MSVQLLPDRTPISHYPKGLPRREEGLSLFILPAVDAEIRTPIVTMIDPHKRLLYRFRGLIRYPESVSTKYGGTGKKKSGGATFC